MYVLVWSKHEYHVHDTNQQDFDTRPYWIAKNRNIPSSRAGCTSRHSACLCSRPACCSVDHRRAFNVRREEEDADIASSRAASNTPQKRDCRPSPEQVNSKTTGDPEALLSQFQSAQEPGRGEQESSWICGWLSRKRRRMTDGGTRIICSRRGSEGA